MSVDIKVTTNELKVRAKFEKKRGRITPELLVGMRRALMKLRGQEVKDLARGRFGLKTGKGGLMRSLAIAIKKRGDEVVGFMGTNLPYAPAHEFGATVKGKPWLTIPFPGITGRALEYANTFFQKSKAGNLILFQNTGATTIRPLFTLKHEVKLKKKKWMSKSFKATKKDLLSIMRKSMREAIAT